MTRGTRVTVACAQCGRQTEKLAREANRAKKAGYKLYCNKVCSGLHRRKPRSEAEKKRIKKAYDEEYRAKNAARLKKRKHDWYAKFGPAHREEEREHRKKTMQRHVEYCRRPEYKKYKDAYDREYRARTYGEFGEAWLVLLELEREIRRLSPDKYERMKARGYFERSNERRKAIRRDR